MTELPQPFLEEIRARLGDGFDAFLACYDQPHVTSLRLNPFRENAEALAAPFIDAPVPWEPFGRYTKPGTRPGLSLAHFGGAYYMQEASAMLAAAALDVRPGMKVLDLCAAPGGKSGQILRMLAGRGLLVSNEPDAARARMLAGNLERLGAVNAVVTNAYPDRLEPLFPKFFDAILVDAPCSGEGMFRRDPGAIAEWNPGLPEFCHRRQLTILASAAAMLRPGGQLVFSTCTFNGVENEGTVSAFLAAHPEFAPEDFALPGVGASTGGMLRAWPHLLRGEGHFVCRMRRRDGGDAWGREPEWDDGDAACRMRGRDGGDAACRMRGRDDGDAACRMRGRDDVFREPGRDVGDAVYRMRGRDDGDAVYREAEKRAPEGRDRNSARGRKGRGAGAAGASARPGAIREAEALQMLLRDALGGVAPEFLREQRLCLTGDRLYACPEALPALDGIRCPKPGLALCRVGRGYVEPDHALAMALRPDQAGGALALDDGDAWRYLAGEALPCEGKGWMLATWNGLPLGWGKASGGQLKNHLPKGLRRVGGGQGEVFS